MYSTECPDCGASVSGENHGGSVHYFCDKHGEFRIAGSAETAWAEADQKERQRVLKIAAANGKPPLVRREYFDLV